jgi:DNA-binding NtrC family response regulator
MADFRTVAATNRVLSDEVAAGRFREDLYYRLNVFHIEMPPLRDRAQDIPILAHAFVERLATSMNRAVPSISREAMDAMVRYDWPGNVRELANAVERAMVVQRGDAIALGDLPVPLENARREPSGKRSISAMERTHILGVLDETGWNISEAARILEVDRSTVYNKIKHHGLVRTNG